MIIHFTILGNQENLKGNPVPYQRVVGRALWTRQAKRYAAWKEYVQEQYWKQAEERNFIGKPFTELKRARMSIEIYWANEAHGDPDNVFKGIADALFVNDKNLGGSFEFEMDKKMPRVEVKIEIIE